MQLGHAGVAIDGLDRRPSTGERAPPSKSAPDRKAVSHRAGLVLDRAQRHDVRVVVAAGHSSASSASCALTARIPGTLLATIATPLPEPHTSTPRSASPSATMRAAGGAAESTTRVFLGAEVEHLVPGGGQRRARCPSAAKRGVVGGERDPHGAADDTKGPGDVLGRHERPRAGAPLAGALERCRSITVEGVPGARLGAWRRGPAPSAPTRSGHRSPPRAISALPRRDSDARLEDRRGGRSGGLAPARAGMRRPSAPPSPAGRPRGNRPRGLGDEQRDAARRERSTARARVASQLRQRRQRRVAVEPHHRRRARRAGPALQLVETATAPRSRGRTPVRRPCRPGRPHTPPASEVHAVERRGVAHRRPTTTRSIPARSDARPRSTPPLPQRSIPPTVWPSPSPTSIATSGGRGDRGRARAARTTSKPSTPPKQPPRPARGARPRLGELGSVALGDVRRVAEDRVQLARAASSRSACSEVDVEAERSRSRARRRARRR